MTSSRARALVGLSILVSGATVVVSGAAEGQLPRPRQLLALGVVGVGLAALADSAPRLAAPMAGLVAVSVVIARGEGAARGIIGGVTSSQPLGSRPVPSGSASLVAPSSGGSGSTPGVGGGEAGGKTREATGPGPTGGAGRLIGYPGQGTHSRTSYPHNWQSDEAVDIGLPFGSPVYAVAAGTISKVGGSGNFSGRFGGYSLTLSGGGDRYYYAHLARVDVRPGQRVTAGQQIGTSGKANGVDHIHFAAEHGNPVAISGIG